MPRANRYYAPVLSGTSSLSPIHGLQDIRTSMFKTHRCHKKEFLLKFAKDRKEMGSDSKKNRF